MYIVSGLVILISIVAYVLSAKTLVHMFQLNSYKPKVQNKWYKEHFGRIAANVVLAVVALGFIIVQLIGIKSEALNWICAVVVAVCSLCVLVASLPKPAKKPLVYTMRIKRLFASMAIVMLIAVVFDVISFVKEIQGDSCRMLISPLVAGLTPFVVLFCNLLNRPVENAVKNHYINEAKTMLKNSPNLEISVLQEALERQVLSIIFQHL